MASGSAQNCDHQRSLAEIARICRCPDLRPQKTGTRSPRPCFVELLRDVPMLTGRRGRNTRNAARSRHKAAIRLWSATVSIALRDGISEGDVARFQIQFSFGRRAKHSRTLCHRIRLPNARRRPSPDNFRSVYTRASHVHQFIDAKDDRHADRSEASRQKAIYSGEQDHERRARDRGHPFRCDH